MPANSVRIDPNDNVAERNGERETAIWKRGVTL